MKKALLILAFLTSCSWSNMGYQMVDVAFEPYAAKFQRVCSVPVFSSIVFKDFPPGYFGHCANYGPNSSLNVVYINRTFWNTATETQRYILIFHELGHCVLDRRHKEGLTQVGSYPNGPISLMYPTPYGYEPVFESNKNYYYNELCGGHE